jgi:hypothetical protein
VGVEYFNRLGQLDDQEGFDEQSHQLGPVITFSPFETIHMHGSLAYLFGISDGADDSTVILEIGFEF